MNSDVFYEVDEEIEETSSNKSNFCNKNNIDYCIAYLCQEVQSLGFSPLTSNGASRDVVNLVNVMYGLIGLQRQNMKKREEYDDRIGRLLSDFEVQRTSYSRLKEKVEQTERTHQTTIETHRRTSLKLKALQCDLKAEKDETKRLQSVLQQRDAQYHHEKRRKEMEYNQIKERLQHTMNDKKLEKKLGMDIANTLQRPDKKRGLWQTPSVSTRHEEDLQSQVMAGYENRNKILLEENLLLRETLYNMYASLPTSGHAFQTDDKLSGDDHVTNAITNPTESNASSALQSASQCLSSYVFQMPYQKVAQKIQQSFEDKFKSVKNRLCLFEEVMEKEWNLRKQKYEEEIDDLKSRLGTMEETIKGQNLFLKASINIEGSPIQITKDWMEDKEIFLKQQQTFLETKKNFDKEREIYTDALLRLARERRDFHKEKVDFFKHQLSLSPVSPMTDLIEDKSEKFIHMLPAVVISSPEFNSTPTQKLDYDKSRASRNSDNESYFSAIDENSSLDHTVVG